MFYYFGYGSNMNITSLQAKGVQPRESKAAVLPGWRLRFNVEHFFRHEGGMGNIEPTSSREDEVHGVVHLCEDAALAALDEVEAYGIGYDRVEVPVHTGDGPVTAIAYVGYPSFINNACQPTRRYLNILVKGAQAAGLDEAYVNELAAMETLVKRDYPKFEIPEQPNSVFRADDLVENPLLTAIAGAVFDMQNARPRHEYVKTWFGGKDMTLFHLKRLDSSDGTETLDDIREDRLSDIQRRYLNEYLHEFNDEYEFAGRFVY